MKKHSIILFIFFSWISAYGQDYWGNVYGGNQNDESFAIEIDYLNGNSSITVGYFTGSCNFSGTNYSSSGLSDIFITKHSSTGSLLWVKKIGGTGEERAVSVSLDASGNIFITGHFWGSFEFGGTIYTSYGQEDAFIAKLDPNGNPIWFTQEGGTSSDLALSIEVDTYGNPVITGQFNGVTTFGSTVLTAQQEDVFVAKYNGSTGNLLWVKQGSAKYSDRGIAICTDENANVYVTGQFSDTITFDNTHNYNLYNGIYVIKFNASGSEQWFRVIAGGLTNIAYDITADNAGHVYLTGDFTGGLQFLSPINVSLTNPLNYKIFLAKLTTAGNLVWAKADGSDNPITSRAVDVKGSQVGIAGMFKCTFNDYANLYGAGTFNSVGYWDCFATSYNTNGTRQWARQWASASNDKSTGLVIDQSGVFLLSGSANKQLNVPQPSFSSINWVPTYIANAPNTGYCSDPQYGYFKRFSWAGKADAFTGKLIDPLREPYDNYYREAPGCTKPFVPGCINSSTTLTPFTGGCTPDTIEFCGKGWLYANTKTYPDTSNGTGPNYNYSWTPAHGDTTNFHITTNGNYELTMTTKDGCYTSSDDVYVIIHPIPPIPLITDNAVVNDHDLITQLIEGCEPDSFLLTGTPLGSLSNYSYYQWGTIPTTDSTTWVSSTGTYYFYVTDSIGCTRSNQVNVNIHSTFNNLNLDVICYNDIDNNDSIDICAGTTVNTRIIDLISNTTAIPSLQGGCLITAPGYSYNASFVNNLIGFPNSPVGFIPTVDDQVYSFNCHLWQQNICDTAHYYITDSLFININPNPVALVNVTGPNTFCSGDSVLITATGNGPINWSYNSAAEAYFNGIDTLIIDMPTSIYVTVSIVDSNGCSNNAYDYLDVYNPTPPNAYTNPMNGLICPNDSVMLYVSPAGYLSYTWVGPGLSTYPNLPMIYTSIAGTYYCIVVDANGCEMVTNIVEVIEYSTPYIYALPNNILCYTGDTATLYVTTNPGSVVNWVNPSSGGSSLSVQIDQPGIYTCEVLSCGILTISNLSIEIDTNSVQLFTYADSVFCENTDFVISATPGYLNYVWQPGSLIGQSITVSSGGNYYVTIIDEYGCSFTSDTVHLISYPTTAEDPDTTSGYFCAPDYTILYASASGVVTWFDSPTSNTPINTGNSFTTPILNTTTTYYVQNENDSCISNRIPVHAIEVPCDTILIPNVFTPNGDGVNDEINFSMFGSTCLRLTIYDRWGGEVFSSNQTGVTWKGNNYMGNSLNDGVYFYVAEYCPHHGPLKVYKGFIQLFN